MLLIPMVLKGGQFSFFIICKINLILSKKSFFIDTYSNKKGPVKVLIQTRINLFVVINHLMRRLFRLYH